MGRAPMAFFLKQMFSLPRLLAVDFEKLCGAEQICGVASDQHQVGEPVQKPDENLDFRERRRRVHRGLSLPLPEINVCSAVRTRSSTPA